MLKMLKMAVSSTWTDCVCVSRSGDAHDLKPHAIMVADYARNCLPRRVVLPRNSWLFVLGRKFTASEERFLRLVVRGPWMDARCRVDGGL